VLSILVLLVVVSLVDINISWHRHHLRGTSGQRLWINGAGLILVLVLLIIMAVRRSVKPDAYSKKNGFAEKGGKI
jgi:hypothetical protein